MVPTRPPVLAPINNPFTTVHAWADSQPHDVDVLVQAAAWSPTFSEQSFPAGPGEVRDLWTTGGDVSWLGGPAVAPLDDWPRSSAGTALAHVMTVALADADSAADAQTKAAWPHHAEGLPTAGALEVFHDLRTFGWERGDLLAGAWMVRWVPEPDRSVFAAEPDDLDTPGPVCQAGLFLPGWTMTSAEDLLSAPEQQFQAAEAMTEAYRRTWTFQRGLPQSNHPVPTTHLYGHSQHSTSRALSVLGDVLPVAGGDVHRLVVEIESWTHLDGWFGDAGTLQVWMRGSDLAARRFGDAWCIIRTD